MIEIRPNAQSTNLHCPDCQRVTSCELIDSVNWGNILAMCWECDTEFDYTPVDHRAILAEARRGW